MKKKISELVDKTMLSNNRKLELIESLLILFNDKKPKHELLLDFVDKINPVLISENCIGINKQEVEDYIDIYL